MTQLVQDCSVFRIIITVNAVQLHVFFICMQISYISFDLIHSLDRTT